MGPRTTARCAQVHSHSRLTSYPATSQFAQFTVLQPSTGGHRVYAAHYPYGFRYTAGVQRERQARRPMRRPTAASSTCQSRVVVASRQSWGGLLTTSRRSLRAARLSSRRRTTLTCETAFHWHCSPRPVLRPPHQGSYSCTVRSRASTDDPRIYSACVIFSSHIQLYSMSVRPLSEPRPHPRTPIRHPPVPPRAATL